MEGYVFKSADSLDYSRIDDLDEKYFPFLKENIVTNDGLVIAADPGLRRKLMKEAKLLSDLTDAGSARHAELKQMEAKLVQLNELGAPGNAIQAMQDIRDQVVNDVRQQEIQQTENLDDAQVVELVENAIRTRPQDFPLLAKYYLNAE